MKAVRAGEVRDVAFRELLRRRTLVSVHMKNDTPSCDRQVAALAELAAELERAGVDAIAVSRNTAGAHRRYATEKRLPFTLVSDPDDQFARATDSLVSKSMYGRQFVGPARAAYVLETDGTVLARVEKLDTRDAAAQLRALLESL